MGLGPLTTRGRGGKLRASNVPERLSVALSSLARRMPSPLALTESPEPIPTMTQRPIEAPQTDPDWTVEENAT